jgi:hypothetical protein
MPLRSPRARQLGPGSRESRRPASPEGIGSRGGLRETRKDLRAELGVVGPHRHLARLAILNAEDGDCSRPVRSRECRVSPVRNCSGRIPIMSRFERWIRS